MKYRIHVCNLAPHSGSCKIGNKEYRWDFGDYIGPIFLGKNGEPLKNQPKENDPVWEKFHDWLEALQGPLPWREAKRHEKAAIADATNGVSRK